MYLTTPAFAGVVGEMPEMAESEEILRFLLMNEKFGLKVIRRARLGRLPSCEEAVMMGDSGIYF
jgi:hypothetical protein